MTGSLNPPIKTPVRAPIDRPYLRGFLCSSDVARTGGPRTASSRNRPHNRLHRLPPCLTAGVLATLRSSAIRVSVDSRRVGPAAGPGIVGNLRDYEGAAVDFSFRSGAVFGGSRSARAADDMGLSAGQGEGVRGLHAPAGVRARPAEPTSFCEDLRVEIATFPRSETSVPRQCLRFCGAGAGFVRDVNRGLRGA
jgi:hypothetical protein